MTDVFLFKAALVGYLACAVLYGVSLAVRRVFPAKAGAWLMLVALVLHTFSFAFHWGMAGSLAVGLYGTLSLFAWVMAAAYLGLQLKTKTRVLGAFVAPATTFVMIIASIELGGQLTAPAFLKGSLVTSHVFLSVAGEALFALASCAGLMYLIQDRLLKRKQAGTMSRLLPSLQDLDRINHWCLVGGFLLLTLGGLAGSFWARIVWGSHWQWDPKQVWTLLAWAAYGFLLHQRLAIGWRGRTAARWSLTAFLIFLVLLIAGQPFFPTIHRFV